MKEKFKKVKDRQKFFRMVSEKTGCSIHNVTINWFGKQFVAVPKNRLDFVDSFLDVFIEFEKELKFAEQQLLIKYFGK